MFVTQNKIKGKNTPLVTRFIKFTNNLVSLIYPFSCINCRDLVTGSGDRVPLCEKCRSVINFITDDAMYKNTGLKNIAGFFSLGYYEGVLRNLLTNLKYNKKTKIVGFLAEEAAKGLCRQFCIPPISEYDIVLPVPLHMKKLQERGFNQSELLAIDISKILRKPVACDVVYRVKETLPQNKLKIEERFSNLDNAFEINEKNISKISNKNVIIIDDILTTGATVESMAKLLKKFGALNIFVITISKTNIKRLNC